MYCCTYIGTGMQLSRTNQLYVLVPLQFILIIPRADADDRNFLESEALARVLLYLLL